MDSRKSQTSTATPAQPGDFPDWFNDERVAAGALLHGAPSAQSGAIHLSTSDPSASQERRSPIRHPDAKSNQDEVANLADRSHPALPGMRIRTERSERLRLSLLQNAGLKNSARPRLRFSRAFFDGGW